MASPTPPLGLGLGLGFGRVFLQALIAVGVGLFQFLFERFDRLGQLRLLFRGQLFAPGTKELAFEFLDDRVLLGDELIAPLKGLLEKIGHLHHPLKIRVLPGLALKIAPPLLDLFEQLVFVHTHKRSLNRAPRG